MSFVNPQSCCPTNSAGEPLTCATDSVTVCQGTTPWIVQAQGVEAIARDLTCILDSVTVCQGANVWTVEIGAASLFALETVTVFQGTSPWVVSGTVAATQSGVWTVNVVEPVTVDGTVSLSAGTLAALETVTVLQGTSPWVVSGAVTVSNFPASQVVTAVDLDIRNLTCLTDSVTICPGVDPIPVTFDGTISVALDCATDSVTICPGAAPIPVTQSGVWTVGRTWDLNFATDQVDASGSVVALDGPTLTALETVTVLQGTSPWVVSGAVTATDLDIRNLDCLTDSVTVCVVDPLPVTTVVGFQTRSDTYTVPGNGVTVDTSTNPLKNYAIQVTGTGGSATTWDVRLEGSLDGVNFTEIVRHTTIDGNSTTKWSGANLSPSLYFRSRCVTLTLGPASNIVVVILGSN